jgi:hypothetical protein
MPYGEFAHVPINPIVDLRWRVDVKPRSWSDLWKGRRRLTLVAKYINILQRSNNTAMWSIYATPWGLREFRDVSRPWARQPIIFGESRS